MSENNKNVISKLVNEGIKAEDVQVFSIYLDKQKMIQEAVRSWTKNCTTISFSLFAALAFLLKYKTGTNVEQLFDIDEITLVLLIMICVFGIRISSVWEIVHKDLVDWQLRSNAVLANVEAKILDPKLVHYWNTKGNEKDTKANILEQCGMWNMICVFEPPMGNRPQKDSMDILKKIATTFKIMWTLILIGTVLLLCLSILKP